MKSKSNQFYLNGYVSAEGCKPHVSHMTYDNSCKIISYIIYLFQFIQAVLPQ